MNGRVLSRSRWGVVDEQGAEFVVDADPPQRRRGRRTLGQSAGRSIRPSPARCSQRSPPAGVKAALIAAEALEHDHDAALKHWRLQLERAQYQADRAERRYHQVEPENRLVARGLERSWEHALQQLAARKGGPYRDSQSSGPAPGREPSLGGGGFPVWDLFGLPAIVALSGGTTDDFTGGGPGRSLVMSVSK
jgi:hypothetical protein